MDKTEIAKEVLHEYHKQHTAPMQLACLSRELLAHKKQRGAPARYYKKLLRARIKEIENKYFA